MMVSGEARRFKHAIFSHHRSKAVRKKEREKCLDIPST
jgi:hypothetical protein